MEEYLLIRWTLDCLVEPPMYFSALLSLLDNGYPLCLTLRLEMQQYLGTDRFLNTLSKGAL